MITLRQAVHTLDSFILVSSIKGKSARPSFMHWTDESTMAQTSLIGNIVLYRKIKFHLRTEDPIPPDV